MRHLFYLSVTVFGTVPYYNVVQLWQSFASVPVPPTLSCDGYFEST